LVSSLVYLNLFGKKSYVVVVAVVVVVVHTFVIFCKSIAIVTLCSNSANSNMQKVAVPFV